MPVAKIDGPPLPIEKKRVLIKEITDAMEKAYQYPRSVYGVIIKENSPENVGSGGIIIADKIKSAQGK